MESVSPGTARFCVSVHFFAVADGKNPHFLIHDAVDHTVIADAKLPVAFECPP